MSDEHARAIRRYIGQRIQHARDVDGIGQDEQAARLGWTRNIQANIESGRRRIDVETLCHIGMVQGRPVSWYLADAPDSIAGAIPGLLSRHRYLEAAGSGQFPPRLARSRTAVPSPCVVVSYAPWQTGRASRRTPTVLRPNGVRGDRGHGARLQHTPVRHRPRRPHHPGVHQMAETVGPLVCAA